MAKSASIHASIQDQGVRKSTESRQEEAMHHAEEVVQEKPDRKWQSYLWDTLDKSPEERRFMFKLDAAIITFACLGYFIKYLDQANLNNAFVSGMKEDLGLYKNQLNYMQSLWTVGYVIGQIPSNIILTRVRPSIWIPFVEIAWSVLTMGMSRCDSAKQIYVIRFFVGLFESAFYPGMAYIIGSWYRSDELAKRSCIFHTSSAIATMFSGYLMAAVYHLGGTGGFSGWQWLFLIDGVISIPIAIGGYFILPDLPDNCRAWYFSQEEIALGKRRMQLEGRKARAPYTRATFKRIFSSWHIYALSLLYVTFNNGNNGAAPVWAQWLKDSKNPKYSITQINTLPTIAYAVQIVTTLTYAWLSDTVLNGNRLPPIIFGGVVNVIIYASLADGNIALGWRWACYILAGCGYGLSGLIMAWGHEICTNDNEERAIVIASMNEMAYVLQAWLPLIVWQQVDAPQYQKGFITVTCLSILLIITGFVTKFLHKRELAARAANGVERQGLYDDSESSSQNEPAVQEVQFQNKDS